jgi:hypothetical protein
MKKETDLSSHSLDVSEILHISHQTHRTARIGFTVGAFRSLRAAARRGPTNKPFGGAVDDYTSTHTHTHSTGTSER